MSIQFKLHHNGCAVKNLERAIKYYVDAMGYEVYISPFKFEEENIIVCFLKFPNENVLLELIEGINDKNPVKKYIEQFNGGIYHSCYQVENIYEAISYLKKYNFIPLKKKFMENDRYIAKYMLTPDNYLIEFIQVKEGNKI